MVFVYLYLIQLIIRPQDFLPIFLGWPTAFLTIIPGIIYGILFRQKGSRITGFPHFYLFVGFLLVIFISTTLNVRIGEAVDQVEIFLKRIMAFFMLVMLITDEYKLRNTLGFYMFLTALLGVHSYLQVSTGAGFSGLPPLLQYNPPRAVWLGVFDGSNTFGVLFITAIPLCIEFMTTKGPFLIRALSAVCLPLSIMGLYFVDSRGDTLAAIGMVALYCLLRFSKKTNIALLVLAISFLGYFLPSRMALVTTSESSAHERTWLWEQGIDMMRDNPLLGVGAGQFSEQSESGLIAHSNHVSVLAELGLIGYFLFLSIHWFTFKGLLAVIASFVDITRIRGMKLAVVEKLRYYNEISSLQLSSARALLCSMVGFVIATLFIVLLTDLLFLALAFGVASFSAIKTEKVTGPVFSRTDIIGTFIVMFMMIFLYYFIAH